MPGFSPKGATGSQDGNAQRTTFRPPWVKDSPPPIPMPTAPWIKSRQPSQPQTQNPPSTAQAQKPEKPVLKKQGNVTTIPIVRDEPKTNELPPNPSALKKPVNKEIKKELPEKPKPVVKTQDSTDKKNEVKKKTVKIQEPVVEEVKKKPTVKFEPGVEKNKSVMKEESCAPPPPMPPPPPPPPPKIPPPPPGFERKPVTPQKLAKIDALRSRPRRRPDWSDMMKEVEEGVKLKHVHCNDRSAPVLPESKAKGQFVYESETNNAHNLLLKQIQTGVRLKKVKTNDRSRPMIDGLRKFRRQITLDEHIQKCPSMADVVAMAAEPDELDDIDKVRDDLQSTKQMLALELRNKETLERENKRLQARLLNLEVELEKEKAARRLEIEKGKLGEAVAPIRTAEDDQLIMKLKEEASESAKQTKEMEKMYKHTAEELDVTRSKLESAWLQNAQLEMELKTIRAQGGVQQPITKQPSKKLIASMSNARPESSSEDESEEEESSSESESEDDKEADKEASKERRQARELKMLSNKLQSFKDKRIAATKEKTTLKDQFSKLSKQLREEQKKYRVLQKEVDKMAKLVRDVEDDVEEEEVEEEEEETESETESESSEDEGVESDGEKILDSWTPEEKIPALNKKIKFHESKLNTLKKSNYLLKANIDRRRDELNRQKEMAISLQEDLNAVLAELG